MIELFNKLIKDATALQNSKFNTGEEIVYCVDYSLGCLYNINTKIFKTPKEALFFYETVMDESYAEIYPCFNIWT